MHRHQTHTSVLQGKDSVMGFQYVTSLKDAPWVHFSWKFFSIYSWLFLNPPVQRDVWKEDVARLILHQSPQEECYKSNTWHRECGASWLTHQSWSDTNVQWENIITSNQNLTLLLYPGDLQKNFNYSKVQGEAKQLDLPLLVFKSQQRHFTETSPCASSS